MRWCDQFASELIKWFLQRLGFNVPERGGPVDRWDLFESFLHECGPGYNEIENIRVHYEFIRQGPKKGFWLWFLWLLKNETKNASSCWWLLITMIAVTVSWYLTGDYSASGWFAWFLPYVVIPAGYVIVEARRKRESSYRICCEAVYRPRTISSEHIGELNYPKFKQTLEELRFLPNTLEEFLKMAREQLHINTAS